MFKITHVQQHNCNYNTVIFWAVSEYQKIVTEGESDGTDVVSSIVSKKEYDCVICNQTTPSTDDKPMGLVVLLQVCRLIYLFLE
jgi:hypothetical protein